MSRRFVLGRGVDGRSFRGARIRSARRGPGRRRRRRRRPSAWSVSALLLAAGDALAARFGAVTVRGELSGSTRASSGHCYFTLKDAAGGAGALRCAMFKRAAALSNVPLQDGLQVELRGRLAVYEARGELQMVVESMQRLGAGQLYEEFLRLRARLAAEGLFDAAAQAPAAAVRAHRRRGDVDWRARRCTTSWPRSRGARRTCR